MKKNLLVTLADKNYIDQAKQLFSSAYWNGGWDGDYMLLSFEIPEKDLVWFRKKGILIYKCKRLCNRKDITRYKYNSMKDSTIILLNKFYLFKPYFKKWDNIVYLDSDMIVRASLRGLKNLKGFNAIEDLIKLNEQFLSYDKIKNKNLLKYLNRNYKLNQRGFNAGVMVFDTNIIGRKNFFTLMKLFDIYKDIFGYGDQPIFNLYFYKKWNKLPLVYNANANLILNDKRIKNIVSHITGFGIVRPWKKNSPFYKEWKKNLDKADLIDIKNPVIPIKILSKKEIIKYSNKLKTKMFFFYYKLKFRIIIMKIDRYIGLIGLFLKKHSPKLYNFLKKLKNIK